MLGAEAILLLLCLLFRASGVSPAPQGCASGRLGARRTLSLLEPLHRGDPGQPRAGRALPPRSCQDTAFPLASLIPAEGRASRRGRR